MGGKSWDTAKLADQRRNTQALAATGTTGRES